MTDQGKPPSGRLVTETTSTTPENPSSPRSNDATYTQLKEYESRRRLAHSSKFDSMSLHWKSYRDLLSAAMVETGRAHRLVLGTCRSHQVYSEALNAVHEDVYLDEKGNVATEKQQKLLSNTRKTSQEQKATVHGKSVLSEIRQAQQVIASEFGDNARNMDEEIAATIGSLLEDLKKHFATMEELGSLLLGELEKTEVEVTTAWQRYLAQADWMSSAGSGTSASPQETAPNGALYDTWVVEAQYRVAVNYQNVAWDKGSTILDDLFQQVKKDEIQRRMNLREFLVAFVQRQQRLFLNMQGLNNNILEGLVGMKLTQADIEQEMHTAIKCRTAAGSFLSEMREKSMPSLDSPLASDLMSKAKVVERRVLSTGVPNIGSTSDWKVSLAIITADSYLHFFDLDDSRVGSSSPPEVAFQVLMPNVNVPTYDNLQLGKLNFSKGWSDTLTPTDSVVLARCMVQLVDETSFIVIEKGGGATTASKMFGKLVDKRIHVRTMEKSDKDDVIAVLTTQY